MAIKDLRFKGNACMIMISYMMNSPKKLPKVWVTFQQHNNNKVIFNYFFQYGNIKNIL